MRVTALISDNTVAPVGLVPLSQEDIVATSAALVASLPKLLAIAPLLSDSFELAREISSPEDLQAAGHLQGIYIGQIKARLLRLFENARSGEASSAGACIVHIVQNEQGAVLDVVSDECERNDEYRSEIDRAIRRASPLPIPPEGLAMGSYLTLDLSTL